MKLIDYLKKHGIDPAAVEVVVDEEEDDLEEEKDAVTESSVMAMAQRMRGNQ